MSLRGVIWTAWQVSESSRTMLKLVQPPAFRAIARAVHTSRKNFPAEKTASLSVGAGLGRYPLGEGHDYEPVWRPDLVTDVTAVRLVQHSFSACIAKHISMLPRGTTPGYTPKPSRVQSFGDRPTEESANFRVHADMGGGGGSFRAPRSIPPQPSNVAVIYGFFGRGVTQGIRHTRDMETTKRT